MYNEPVWLLRDVLEGSASGDGVADLLHDVVGKVLHSLRGAAHAHKLVENGHTLARRSQSYELTNFTK